MSLFLDGGISTIDDLTAQDASLLAVSATEGINLNEKLGLAQNELQIEIAAVFEQMTSIYTPVLGMAPLTVDHLAVTPALATWSTFRTLALIYRDAYFTQLNARYQAKWQQFERLEMWAKNKWRETGAGIVLDPLPRAATPVISLVNGVSAGGTYYASVAWVNSAGEEGTPSTVVDTVAPDGQSVLIAPASIPSNATGWNVYAGTAPAALSLQNGSPLATSQTWTYSAATAVPGRAPGAGQIPNVTRTLPRVLQRG